MKNYYRQRLLLTVIIAIYTWFMVVAVSLTIFLDWMHWREAGPVSQWTAVVITLLSYVAISYFVFAKALED